MLYSHPPLHTYWYTIAASFINFGILTACHSWKFSLSFSHIIMSYVCQWLVFCIIALALNGSIQYSTWEKHYHSVLCEFALNDKLSWSENKLITISTWVWFVLCNETMRQSMNITLTIQCRWKQKFIDQAMSILFIMINYLHTLLPTALLDRTSLEAVASKMPCACTSCWQCSCEFD